MLRKEISFCIAFAALLFLSSCPTPCPCGPEGEQEGIEEEGECQEDMSIIPDYSWEEFYEGGTSETFHPEFLTSAIGIGFHEGVTVEQRMNILSSIPCLDPPISAELKNDIITWTRVECPTKRCTTKSEILGAVAQLNHMPEVFYASPMFTIFSAKPLAVTNIITATFPFSFSSQDIGSLENKYHMERLICWENEATDKKTCWFVSHHVFAPDTILLAEIISKEPNVLTAEAFWDEQPTFEDK